MPFIINKTTNEVRDVRDETLYDEADWLILSAAWLAEHGMPAFNQSLWRYEAGVVVEGEPEPVVESMSDRHAREQREGYGVTLQRGWVMRWTDDDQLKMGLAKSAADMLAMAQNTSPLVPFYEANRTKHLVTYSEAYQILGEYMALVMAQQTRQEQEAANG